MKQYHATPALRATDKAPGKAPATRAVTMTAGHKVMNGVCSEPPIANRMTKPAATVATASAYLVPGLRSPMPNSQTCQLLRTAT